VADHLDRDLHGGVLLRGAPPGPDRLEADPDHEVDAPAAGGRAPPAAEGGAPAGPQPAIAALVKRIQIGGVLMTLGIVVIVILMIWKPGNG